MIQTVIQLLSSLSIGYNRLGFYVFLFVFFCVYFLLPSKHHLKVLWIFAGNIFFYLQSGTTALFIVLITALIVYTASRVMERIYDRFDDEKTQYSAKEQMALLKTYKRKSIIIMIVAVLLVFLPFAVVKVCRLLGYESVTSFQDFALWENVIIPLGISYYTLSSIGYLLDIYWRKTKPEHNFLYLVVAITYFPIIVQGPISRYPKLVEQFKALPQYDYKRVTYGMQLILWGLFQKMVIADRLLIYVNSILSDPADYYGVEIIVALIFSLLQSYTDFSGCMSIVQGVADMMGIQLEKNFNQPFFAKSGAEYWRRWHITLGGWFRDYIYLPIYMNPSYMKIANKIKKKYGRDIGQLFVTASISSVIWLLTGIWHGTGWNYVAWGLYWYMVIVMEEATAKFWIKFRKRLHVDENRVYYRVWQAIKMFAIALGGRAWIASGGLRRGITIWRHMFAEIRPWVLFDGSMFGHGLNAQNFRLALLCIAVLWIVDLAHENQIKIRDVISRQPLILRWGVYYIAFFTIIIFGMYGPGYDAASFVYGGF